MIERSLALLAGIMIAIGTAGAIIGYDLHRTRPDLEDAAQLGGTGIFFVAVGFALMFLK